MNEGVKLTVQVVVNCVLAMRPVHCFTDSSGDGGDHRGDCGDDPTQPSHRVLAHYMLLVERILQVRVTLEPRVLEIYSFPPT